MSTKYCSRGKHDAEVSEFRKSSRSKDGLQTWCRPCFAEYERERWHNGDKVRKQRNRAASRKRAEDYVWKILTTNQCVDCGESDPIVLEFDHLGDKEFNVSEMLDSYSVVKIAAEIAKCDIRCANCHKRKTARDFGFWRTLR